MSENKHITHITGTFLIQADASFLNGAGLGEGEDRNVTIPKTFQHGKDKIPYVSSQAWKRWLRNTAVEEGQWPKSELRAIGLSEKKTTNKISGELNPVEYPEDDIFGYMKAEKGQGRTKETEGDDSVEDAVESEKTETKGKKIKTKAVMRTSPFAASLLVSIRKSGWRGRDEGFVHLKEGTPQPYTTEFYNTHLQGIFSLDYSRLGIFWNLGDRIELEEAKTEEFLRNGKIKVKEDHGKKGKIYESVLNQRKERAQILFKSLGVLRGGAKQAQFGTDVSPKAVIMSGLSCGNPIFNHLFEDEHDGPVLRIETLKEIISDYSDRILTPVIIGMRSRYFKNENDIKALNKTKIKGKHGKEIEIYVMTPIEATTKIGELLP